jgi:hypothetical protein
LRRNEANVVAEWLDLASDMMRARAGLETDKARGQIDKPAHKLAARYLDAHGDGAASVEADEVEGVLADIEADRGDGFG